MKQRDLVILLEKAGFRLQKAKGKAPHDKYKRGNDMELVPRHREIKEDLAKAIIKRWGLQ